MTDRIARALIFDGPGRARVGDWRVPPPGPGQLRIAVKACGVCHREWHVIAGRIPRDFPAVMGHEPVGIVDAVGDGVDGFEVGGWVTGVGTASLAEYDNVDHRHVAALPNRRASAYHLGEPVTCAINAVNRVPFGINPLVVVNGTGFMGSLIVQALRAKIPAATIVAVDPHPDHRTEALAEGGDQAFESLDKAAARLTALPDVIFEASGAPGSIAAATRVVRNGGTLAVFAHHFSVEPEAVNEWHLRGIAVLNTVPWSAPDLGSEVQEAVRLMRSGRVRLRRSSLRLAGLQEAARLLNGPAPVGRKLIVTFD